MKRIVFIGEWRIKSRSPSATAKTIPIHSLRMDELDCFALLRALRPQRNSPAIQFHQIQLKMNLIWIEFAAVPAELAAIGGFSCLPSLLAARVMGGWPPMAPPREKTSEDKKRSQQQSKNEKICEWINLWMKLNWFAVLMESIKQSKSTPMNKLMNGGAPRPSGNGMKTKEMKLTLFEWNGSSSLSIKQWNQIHQLNAAKGASIQFDWINFFNFISFAGYGRDAPLAAEAPHSSTTIVDSFGFLALWSFMKEKKN